MAYMSIVFFPAPGQSNIAGCYQCSCLKCFFVRLFCCFCISAVGGGEKEDYIKCELIGGGSLPSKSCPLTPAN